MGRGDRLLGGGALVGPGDSIVYESCQDPACPDHRPGTGHAHLIRVERAEAEAEPDNPMGWPIDPAGWPIDPDELDGSLDGIHDDGPP